MSDVGSMPEKGYVEGLNCLTEKMCFHTGPTLQGRGVTERCGEAVTMTRMWLSRSSHPVMKPAGHERLPSTTCACCDMKTSWATTAQT